MSRKIFSISVLMLGLLAACGGTRAKFNGLENGIVLGHQQQSSGNTVICAEFAVAQGTSEADIAKVKAQLSSSLTDGACTRSAAVAVCAKDQDVEGVTVSTSVVIYDENTRKQATCAGTWLTP